MVRKVAPTAHRTSMSIPPDRTQPRDRQSVESLSKVSPSVLPIRHNNKRNDTHLPTRSDIRVGWDKVLPRLFIENQIPRRPGLQVVVLVPACQRISITRRERRRIVARHSTRLLRVMCWQAEIADWRFPATMLGACGPLRVFDVSAAGVTGPLRRFARRGSGCWAAHGV